MEATTDYERLTMQLLEFIFSSFWIFWGVLILLACLLNGIAAIVGAFRGH